MNVMNALMMVVFMVIMLPIYLLVQESKEEYESRTTEADSMDYLG